MLRYVVGALLISVTAFSNAGQAATPRLYNFSPVNQQSLQVSAGFWNPILAYVSAKSGVELNLKLGRTSADTTAHVLAQEVDFAFTNHLFSPERAKLGWRVFGRRDAPPIRAQIVTAADGLGKNARGTGQSGSCLSGSGGVHRVQGSVCAPDQLGCGCDASRSGRESDSGTRPGAHRCTRAGRVRSGESRPITRAIGSSIALRRHSFADGNMNRARADAVARSETRDIGLQSAVRAFARP